MQLLPLLPLSLPTLFETGTAADVVDLADSQQSSDAWPEWVDGQQFKDEAWSDANLMDPAFLSTLPYADMSEFKREGTGVSLSCLLHSISYLFEQAGLFFSLSNTS